MSNNNNFPCQGITQGSGGTGGASAAAKAWIIGNWKMHPVSPEAQQQLTSQLLQLARPVAARSAVQLAVAPTMLHLQAVQQLLAPEGIGVVAQDVARFTDTGAYTGDVSAQQLYAAGIRQVLIGHSERRSLHHEDTPVLRSKLHAAASAGLSIIFCVGETLEQRMAGLAESVVLGQIDAVFDAIDLSHWQTRLMIAYEPVWAIGTGQTASSEDADSMHAAIRAGLAAYHSSLAALPLLYGGSVKPDNAASLAACAHIDGVLVGGASLDATSFIHIAQAFADASVAG